MSNETKMSMVQADNRLEWIEPDVRELSVRETQAMPTPGGDGARTFPDCSTS